jgi:hypothetical protein
MEKFERKFECWSKGNDRMYRFSTLDEAEELIRHLGWKSKEEFMETALFNTMENQFSDNSWWWPDEITWGAFISICHDLWIEFDGDTVSLAEDRIASFLESFWRNFSDFISDPVQTAHLGCSFSITIGHRTVMYDSDFKFLESSSISGSYVG